MSALKLQNGSRVAVIGGGPSGSLAGFFLKELSERIGLSIEVDLYESRDFLKIGPAGCNMCAGVISESLVQTLAAEGVNLPPIVVQKGLDAYVLHTSDLPPVSITTPSDDLRIATVYRGSGPRIPSPGVEWSSFDNYILELAKARGVRVLRERVSDFSWSGDLPVVHTKGSPPREYELLIGAVGVNSPTLESFSRLGFRFKPPKTTKGFVAEIYLGEEQAQAYLGSSMHIFLLDIPNLKFAALIPKTEYVTVVLLGQNIDRNMVRFFMNSPEVKRCFPPDLKWCFGSSECDIGMACHCHPKLNLGPAQHPFNDRVVLVGDAAISRLYKDGIGAAYITAKAAAVTSIFLGVDRESFQTGYMPVVQRIARDNRIGQVVFFITLFYQKLKFLRRGMVRMAQDEKQLAPRERRMSRVLWDTFTGSASYREIFLRACHPLFLIRLLGATFLSYFTEAMNLFSDRK